MSEINYNSPQYYDITRLVIITSIMQIISGLLTIKNHSSDLCTLNFNHPPLWFIVSSTLAILSGILLNLFRYKSTSKLLRNLIICIDMLATVSTVIALFQFLDPKFSTSLFFKLLLNINLSKSVSFCITSFLVYLIQLFLTSFNLILLWFIA